ncbi:hypothetical protein GQ607_005476 [Colletotrichum asianum]|uniref:Uncharacterized protein n=1 Tax=Colletotrichum asianum TaxID=702518 RepID=A0A8H3WMK6_9PEZI|nr:hypothetical protein GQ607_005476 [Colletotrichum asianum]
METRKSQGLTCDSVTQAGLVFWTAGATPTATAAAAAAATATARAALQVFDGHLQTSSPCANTYGACRDTGRLQERRHPIPSLTVWPPDAVASSVGGFLEAGTPHDWGGTCSTKLRPSSFRPRTGPVPRTHAIPRPRPRQTRYTVGLYLP